MKKFEMTIDSGININEIIPFFKKMATEIVDERIFIGENWTVEIDALKDRVHGVIRIPRTHILFYGDQEACEALIEDYRKQFMRGGG